MLKCPNFSRLSLKNYAGVLKNMLSENLSSIDALSEQSTPTWQSLMEPLDNMEDKLNQYWSPLSHLHSVRNSDELREVYQECIAALSDYGTAIGQHEKLFLAIKKIHAENETQEKILIDDIKGFELSGVALDSEKKKRYKDISSSLSSLSTQFENNLLDATNAWKKEITDESLLSGLPEHAIQTAKAQSDKENTWVLTLDFPCYYAVLTYADDEGLRKEMYEAYTTRASELGPQASQFDNSEVIKQILQLKDEKAKLLDFDNYAALSVENKMAPSPEKVMEFLHDLCEKGLDKAKQEFKDLELFAEKSLNPWDVSYYSEKERLARYDLSEEELRPYFVASTVIKGMFDIVKTLYGVSIKEKPGVDTWHQDVRFFELYNEAGEITGGVYMDLYAREKKRGGAWMDDCVCYRELPDGSVQRPIAYLTCNFAPASGGKPACLSHDEVVTLFHEFGHCLHHLLTKVGYLSASGINGVEWDAVELPSQFFENYCWQWDAIQKLSSHVESGEQLPREMFDKMIKAKNFQSAMAMMRQLEFSLFDFTIHLQDNDRNYLPVLDTLKAIKAKYAVTPSLESNRFPNSFSHIFAGGYAAGYYSYKWAEVLACDVFAKFEEDGVFSPVVGQAFLEEILSRGSSRKALDSFIAFRGREPDVNALLVMNGIAA